MRARRSLVLAAVAVVALTGCLPFAPAPGDPSPAPVYDQDFPDPAILKVGTTYYAYATSGPRGTVQTARSTDLVHWSPLASALARVPAWAQGPSVWAPTVIPRAGGYVMYYAANVRNTGMWCVSFARSASPTGPFVDTTTAPFVCQWERLGSIDPYAYVDHDGAAYLIWQSQGVPNQEPSMLWGARLSDDGTALVPGTTTWLLQTDHLWEGNVIENPAMAHTPHGYFLFYSGNEWVSPDYATGVARCDGPLGPCSRIYSNAVLASRGAMLGPGGPAPVVAPDGGWRLGFHAWTAPRVGYGAGGQRRLHLLPISFLGNDPIVG